MLALRPTLETFITWVQINKLDNYRNLFTDFPVKTNHLEVNITTYAFFFLFAIQISTEVTFLLLYFPSNSCSIKYIKIWIKKSWKKHIMTLCWEQTNGFLSLKLTAQRISSYHQMDWIRKKKNIQNQKEYKIYEKYQWASNSLLLSCCVCCVSILQ